MLCSSRENDLSLAKLRQGGTGLDKYHYFRQPAFLPLDTQQQLCTIIITTCINIVPRCPHHCAWRHPQR